METTEISKWYENINLEQYAKKNVPIYINELDLKIPEEEQYILRIPIMENGIYFVPKEILWIESLLELAINHQKENNLKNNYCYVTIRNGIVKSEDDDEWHVDGFSMKIPCTPDQNYIWISNNPTEYINQGYTFPKDFDPLKHNIHKFFQYRITDKNHIKKLKSKTLYCIDPYIIHRRPQNTFNKQRTFIRISYAPIPIYDINNTVNPLLEQPRIKDGLQFRKNLISYDNFFESKDFIWTKHSEKRVLERFGLIPNKFKKTNFKAFGGLKVYTCEYGTVLILENEYRTQNNEKMVITAFDKNQTKVKWPNLILE